ncbi:MAG: hypothetical protein HZA49_04475 [Planctomycetes bacterium]|nr:hypothetical protein [Planctomycetota bacterium]
MITNYQSLAEGFAKKVLGANKPIPGFYDSGLEYFNFDALWDDNKVKDSVITALRDFMAREVVDLNKVTKILGTDTVTVNYSFGTLPIVSTVAHLLKKDLVIWSERGDLARNAPKVFGKISANDEVLIVHDLLRETVIAKAILDTLVAASKCRIKGVVVLVNAANKKSLSEMGYTKIAYPVPIYSFVCPA